MIRIDREVVINSSIKRVFNYLKEPSNWSEVWPSLIGVEDVQLTPNGGYSGKFEYKMAGMRFRGTGEFTDFVPNQWIVVKTQGGIHSTLTCTVRSVSPTENKTRVTLTVEYNVPIPLLGKLAEYIILKMNEQEADLAISNLQARFLMDY